MTHPIAQQLGHLTGIGEAGSDQGFELQVPIYVTSTDSHSMPPLDPGNILNCQLYCTLKKKN